MKKVIFINGLIGGLIVVAMMVISTDQCITTGNFEKGMIYGYTAMLIAFSFVFVGIKTFRDKYQGNVISFGKAFKVGILITLVASTLYVIGWLIEFYVFVPDFADIYSGHVLARLKANGASQAEIAEQTASMLQFKEMYKNPLFVVLLTYAEIIPVGLLVTLISALILKRKERKEQLAN